MDRGNLRHPAEGPDRAFAAQGRRPGTQGGKTPCRACTRKIGTRESVGARDSRRHSPVFSGGETRFPVFRIIELDYFLIFRNSGCASPASLERRRVPFMQYFVVMIDYGRRGREAGVDPEITQREAIARGASGEYNRIR